MRTNIDIKDTLMEEAIRLSESKTKKEAVERALEFYIRMLKQRRLLELRGKVTWEGNLDEMRSM
ncbi:MAG TPA: type II toxin-antitoxin system VapB family antitoxin [Chryseosolibacter sp.]